MITTNDTTTTYNIVFVLFFNTNLLQLKLFYDVIIHHVVKY